LLSPLAITGSLNPEALFEVTKYDTVGQHSIEIDLILRCHRYILYGLYSEAETILNQIEASRGISGATLELRYMLATISGDQRLAELYEDLAIAAKASTSPKLESGKNGK
jgi:hypothetical protein